MIPQDSTRCHLRLTGRPSANVPKTSKRGCGIRSYTPIACYGRYPHTDDGVEVRRIFHKLRSIAMENFHEHFKGIFDEHSQVPTKGLITTQRFADGEPSLSTNWPYCATLSMTWAYVSDSKQLEHL